MKIQVRRPTPLAKNQPIKVREKMVFSCKGCNNRYYSHHYFCPECLGEVVSAAGHSHLLLILSCPMDHLQDAISLLQRLSGIAEFDFETALESFPWICMVQSDPAILQNWKECLESAKLSVEIRSTLPEAKRKRRKLHPPLFPANAPAPSFLPSSLIQQIRTSADSIPSPAAKLEWAQTVENAFKLLERLYKNEAERLLFYDFIFQIEEQIREFLSRFTSAKWAEQNFVKRNDRLRESFGQMESEVEAVRDQVQDQL